MGLDVIACSHLSIDEQHPDVHSDGEDSEDDNSYIVYKHYGDFSQHIQGLIPKKRYRKTPKSETLQFRAGAYSVYSEWRGRLLSTALDINYWILRNDPALCMGKPFSELLTFTNCDGMIGSVVSQKLWKDFQDHEDQFKESWKPADMELYNQFMKAFELGAKDGMVWFH